MTRQIALAMAVSLVLTGCAAAPASLADRTERAVQVAAASGWIASRIATPSFEMESFAATGTAHKTRLVIYFEGDGLAFLSPERFSEDPTPLQPLVLGLALAARADTDSNVVYLARPCQYTGLLKACQPDYWTAKRFAPEVIAAMDDAVSQLKARYGASQLTLVGYSGGAAVAALLAERRDDVDRLVSVAGNLSTKRWVELQSLSGSLVFPNGILSAAPIGWCRRV
jgi:hypothetical protein